MFTATLIVFREVFEIAIIICVILAATRQVAYRAYWIGGGIAAGAGVVGVIACFGSLIIGLISKLGEHVFHALVLFIASILIGWSVIWMQQHGREITNQMKEVSQSITKGQKPLYMLAVVIALAVIREGSEVVLFLYGTFAAGQATIIDIIFGTIAGIGLGVLTGFVMYLGLLRIPVKQLFSVSAWLLAFLAAGMVAKATGHLVKADLVPALINPLWDTSAILSQHSLIGRFLSVLVGYQEHPAGIQVLFYVMTLVMISFSFFSFKRIK